MRYVVVQRTGFVPYFLCSWQGDADGWDCARARALSFSGPEARRIAGQLNALRSGPVPVTVEAI